MSGATFDFLPTHELFGFRYTIFQLQIYTLFWILIKVFFCSAIKQSKKRAKKQIQKKKNDKNDEFYVILLTPDKKLPSLSKNGTERVLSSTFTNQSMLILIEKNRDNNWNPISYKDHDST